MYGQTNCWVHPDIKVRTPSVKVEIIMQNVYNTVQSSHQEAILFVLMICTSVPQVTITPSKVIPLRLWLCSNAFL